MEEGIKVPAGGVELGTFKRSRSFMVVGLLIAADDDLFLAVAHDVHESTANPTVSGSVELEDGAEFLLAVERPFGRGEVASLLIVVKPIHHTLLRSSAQCDA